MFRPFTLACTWALVSNIWALEIQFGTELSKVEAEEVLRQVLKIKAHAILEATYKPDYFLVTRKWSGRFEPGDKLLFADCEQIQRKKSAREYVEDLILRTPVLDLPLSLDQRASVGDVAEVEEFPLPDPHGSFVFAVWQREGEHRWGFPRQTIGDMFLVQSGRVYVFGYGRVDGKRRGFWVRFPPAPSYSSLEELVQEILHESKDDEAN